MIGRAAPRHDNMAVFGPAPAPLAMLRGRHRLRLLVHANRAVPVQDIIRDWLGALSMAARRARFGGCRSLFFPVESGPAFAKGDPMKTAAVFLAFARLRRHAPPAPIRSRFRSPPRPRSTGRCPAA